MLFKENRITMSNFEEQAVNNFREYLRIPSVHPNVNYEPCVEFLKRQAKELDLPLEVYEVVPGNPVVVLTWQGTEPQLPAVMLNSHMDVVPVYEESWTHKPFDAHMDADGNIYARGAQDMKCVAIQYLEAVRRLKHRGVTLRRTIHIVFTPDEEIGTDGMNKLVETDFFKRLNIGFALDEGMASPTDEYVCFNGERSVWRIVVHCPGQTGHGSHLLDNTAGEKVRYIIDKFMDFRAQEKQKLTDNPALKSGDVTCVNLTILQGGVQVNVVPEEICVTFDVRIAVTRDLANFEQMVKQWCAEAGPDVWASEDHKEPQYGVTSLDNSNLYWLAFKSATDKMKLKMSQQICPGASDSRFLRGLGIPAIGFSPMNNTPVLEHYHNEFLNKSVFLRGIEIYCEIIPAIANVEDKAA